MGLAWAYCGVACGRGAAWVPCRVALFHGPGCFSYGKIRQGGSAARRYTRHGGLNITQRKKV